MTPNQPPNHHRVLMIGFVLAGIGSFVALVGMIVTGLEKVRTGHGLDTYRTVWLVEFNWVGFLVLMAALGVAIVGALWLHYLEWREIKKLQARYGLKEIDGGDHPLSGE